MQSLYDFEYIFKRLTRFFHKEKGNPISLEAGLPIYSFIAYQIRPVFSRVR